MVILEKDSRYILRFSVKGFELVYDTIIIEDDGTHIRFKDKKGIERTFHHSLLLTSEKLKKEDSYDDD